MKKIILFLLTGLIAVIETSAQNDTVYYENDTIHHTIVRVTKKTVELPGTTTYSLDSLVLAGQPLVETSRTKVYQTTILEEKIADLPEELYHSSNWEINRLMKGGTINKYNKIVPSFLLIESFQRFDYGVNGISVEKDILDLYGTILTNTICILFSALTFFLIFNLFTKKVKIPVSFNLIFAFTFLGISVGLVYLIGLGIVVNFISFVGAIIGIRVSIPKNTIRQ